MARTSLYTILVIGAVTLLYAGSVRGGPCYDPDELCTEPCPAENSCFSDDDCEAGLACRPACVPSSCGCKLDGTWGCTADCAWACAEPPEHANPPEYVIIDLGTLGGGSSVGLGINDCGQVVGGADTRDGSRRAYLWEAGVMTDLGTLPGRTRSEAWDVNNAGQVVGNSAQGQGGSVFSAFLWEDGEMIDLGDLGGGETFPHAINDSGQVVGASYVSTTRYHAFLWDDGVMRDLGTLGGTHSIAWDINESEYVVGSSFTGSGEHAFLWENGVMTDLRTLGAEGAGKAFGINGAGQVVGKAARADGVFTAFLWDNGQMIDLGAIGGFRGSTPWAINNCGQVVGIPHFLYDPDEGMQDLEYLLPRDGQWFSLTPRDINDPGQIVGTGTFRGLRRAFLMTPIDADFDTDGDTDADDFAVFRACMTGPGARAEPECKTRDINRDGDVDLDDFRAFQWEFTGP